MKFTFKDNAEALSVAKQALFMAYNASNVVGLGVLQEVSGATIDQVWDVASHSPTKLYADYLFGRMMKLGVDILDNKIEVRDGANSQDYQSYARVYPTDKDLFEAAMKELGITEQVGGDSDKQPSSPCPFCGAAHNFVNVTMWASTPLLYRVQCSSCGASGSEDETRQGATEKWDEIVKRYNAYPELVELARSIKAIIDDSQGVQGWHLNNALASWDELITEEEYDLLAKLEGKG